jgi:hypothetical protein
MCIGRAWEAQPIRGGIMGMETIPSSQRIVCALPVIADMLNHRCDIGLQAGEKLRYLVEPSFDRVKARRCGFAIARDWPARRRMPMALENLVKVLRLPAECDRKRFQSPRATAALNRMTLKLSHYRQRHMRALCKFALTPSKLGHALIDGICDCRPILRHAIPPRSAFRAEVSGSASFRDTTEGFSERDPSKPTALRAEIIEPSLKSALTRLSTSRYLRRTRKNS